MGARSRWMAALAVGLMAGCGGSDSSSTAGRSPGAGLESGIEPRAGILFTAAGVGRTGSGVVTNDLFLIQPDGSGLTNLTRTRRDESEPRWSPDGRRIAFVRRASDVEGYPDDCADVYVINADGTGEVNLTVDDACSGEPAWRPDGTRLTFSSDREGDFEVYVVNADGSGLRQLTQGAGPVDGFTASHFQPAFSPDGTRLVFVRQICCEFDEEENEALIKEVGICFVNADGTGQTCPPVPRFSRAPAWSPDGSQVAFSCDDRLCVMNPDGSGLTRLTSEDLSPVFEGVWSPDGAQLAFAGRIPAGDLDRPFRIFVIKPDGSGLRQVTHGPLEESQGSPRFGPGGRQLAFTFTEPEGEGQNWGIAVINVDGTGQRRLAATGTFPFMDWR